MDRSLLAARIQEILKGRPRPAGQGAVRPLDPAPPAEGESEVSPGPRYAEADEEGAFAARCAAEEAASSVGEVLGGRVVDGPAGASLVIERRYEAWQPHGRRTVAHYAEAAAAGASTLPWFLGGDVGRLPGLDGDPSRPRLVFFDLETTGLSGGAGTYAFLVGCGYFEDEAFVTRQYFLRGFGEERAMLEAVGSFVANELSSACLVTYNGRSFDLPLIETRYLFHRRTSPFSSLPHVDMLFPARRLWKHRAVRDLPADALGASTGLALGEARASCALTALEQDVLGLAREDDVPGWEIPGRYFAYARSGDARGLAAVVEHNRLDLLSLAAVTAVVFEMATGQERVARDRQEAAAIARLLESLGRLSDAERCYASAAGPPAGIESRADCLARAEALHWLALNRRRARRFVEAAEAWQALLEVPGLEAPLRREACEALAIHHEHRVRDLAVARAFALGARDSASGGRFAAGVEHRLERLSRKMRGAAAAKAADAGVQAILPAEGD